MPEVPSRSRRQRSRSRRAALGMACALALLASPATVQANNYEARRAGHPLRMVAYVLHPVGFLIDRVVLRPAHWIGSASFLRPVFGHTDDE